MSASFNIIDYMSGLTTFNVGDSVLSRIATDRGVSSITSAASLTERDKDLLTADILYVVWQGGSVLPSMQHQHGQFSMSVGQQKIDADKIYGVMMSLYRKWDDAKADIIPQSGLTWMM